MPLRLLCAALAIALLLAGCQPGGAAEGGAGTAGSAGTADGKHGKEVTIVGYLIGEAPKGLPAVLEAINAKLKKDINAVLELHYIGWSGLPSQYPLLLASGDDVDFIFTANWNYYVSEASKGAFLGLSEDMLRTYMPKHMARLPEAALAAARVNGQVYMVPSSTPDRKVNVALFRKDIMQQAGMTEISKFSAIEPYLAAAKRAYPGMIPLNLDSQYDLPTPFLYLLSEKIAYPQAPIDSGDPLAVGVSFDNEDKSGTIYSMTEEPYWSAEKYAANIMKDWYDKGYVNRNPFANKTRSKDQFLLGKTAVAFGNSIDIAPLLTAAEEKGIGVYVFPLLYPSGTSGETSWTASGVALSPHSKNPGRTLEALDLLMEDPSYASLAYYGIEGVNYVVTGDGKLDLPEGVSAEANTYPPDASGFWFVSKDLFKPMASWTDDYVTLNAKLEEWLKPYPYLNFSFNSENVKDEVANLQSVSTEYAQPLYIGAVRNVDQAFAELKQRLTGAGIDKVKAEVERQAGEFLAGQ